MSKTRNRIEYLYPMYTSESYKKWILFATIPIMESVKDCEWLTFTYEEYLNTFENITEESYEIYKESYKVEYQKWLDGKINHRLLIFNSGEAENFCPKIIQAISSYLCKQPLLLTKFLEKHAISIMDSLLQITSFPIGIIETPSIQQEHFEKYLNEKYNESNLNQLNEISYKRDNFEAKYLLSIYLGVLNSLLDMGVNLHEAKFTTFDFESSYSDLIQNKDWNTLLLTQFKNAKQTGLNHLIRLDGFQLPIDVFIDAFSFTDVSSFLEKVKMIMQYENYRYYMGEPLMVKPECINRENFKKGFAQGNIHDIEKENLVHIDELCLSIQNKLLSVNFKTKKNILFSKINQINIEEIQDFFTEELVDNILKDDDFFDSVLSLLDTFINEEKPKVTGEKQDIITVLQTLENLLKTYYNKDFFITEKKEVDITQNIEELTKKVEKLNDCINTQEEKIRRIQEQFENYLTNGTPLDKKDLRGLSPEMIRNILHKQPIEKSLNYYIRRVLLGTMLIQLGFSSLLYNLNLSTNKTTLPKQVESDNSLLLESNPKFSNSFPHAKAKANLSFLEVETSVSLEDRINLCLSLGNYFENPGHTPYYTSIYDTAPKGFTNKSGLIVGFYAFSYDEDATKYVASLTNVQQLENFVQEHLDECQNYIWKIALYTGDNQQEIYNMLQTKKKIPYQYFSYFVDYDISPFLEESFVPKIKR